MVYLLKT